MTYKSSVEVIDVPDLPHVSLHEVNSIEVHYPFYTDCVRFVWVTTPLMLPFFSENMHDLFGYYFVH